MAEGKCRASALRECYLVWRVHC